MKKIDITTAEQYTIDIARKLRHKNKLSMREFGRIMGVSSSFVGNVENPNYRSKYNLKHIDLLSFHFDISPKEFVSPVPLMDNDHSDLPDGSRFVL